MGVPITIETIGDDAEVGYRVRPDDYYLPDLGLTADETAALRVAVSAISLGDAGARGQQGALMKLGGLAATGRRPDRVAADRARARDAVRRVPHARGRDVRVPRRDPNARAVGPLVQARSLVRRRLRPRPRGDQGLPRRPHRRRQSRSGEPDAFDAPADFQPDDHIEDRPWLLGDEPPVVARLAVDADHVRGHGRARSGADAVVERARRTAAPSSRSRSRTAPRSARSCSASSTTPRSSNRPSCAPTSSRGSSGSRRVTRRDGAGVSPRPVAGAEIQRILALVPWIVAHPGTAKAEIAQRFGMTVEQLDEDLALVLMIGVPPYSPGDYLDVRRRRRVRHDPARRPRSAGRCGSRPPRVSRCSPRGARCSRCPAATPKGRSRPRSTKLERALDLPDVVVEVGEPPYLDGGARRRGRATNAVEIDYWSAGRDELTTRRIDPAVVVLRDGRVVPRRVLPPRGRRAHVPRRPHPRLCAATGEQFEPATSDVDEIAEVLHAAAPTTSA